MNEDHSWILWSLFAGAVIGVAGILGELFVGIPFDITITVVAVLGLLVVAILIGYAIAHDIVQRIKTWRNR